MNNGNKEVKESVLYVIKRFNSESGNSRSDLRVVSWNYGVPMLEKRSFFKKEGEWRTGKALGLRNEDLEIIEQKLPRIKKLCALEGKASIAAAEAERVQKLAAK